MYINRVFEYACTSKHLCDEGNSPRMEVVTLKQELVYIGRIEDTEMVCTLLTCFSPWTCIVPLVRSCITYNHNTGYAYTFKLSIRYAKTIKG